MLEQKKKNLKTIAHQFKYFNFSLVHVSELYILILSGSAVDNALMLLSAQTLGTSAAYLSSVLYTSVYPFSFLCRFSITKVCAAVSKDMPLVLH